MIEPQEPEMLLMFVLLFTPEIVNVKVGSTVPSICTESIVAIFVNELSSVLLLASVVYTFTLH